MELKDVLIAHRQKMNLSQREFARRCGLSNSLISILEMGTNSQTGKKPKPDIETYKKLASGMGITVQSLFEILGNSELVDMTRPPIVIPDSELFRKIIMHMDPADYQMVMEAFERTELKMKEKGLL